MEIEGKNLLIAPSGEFQDAKEVANTLVTTSTTGSPVYLRDLVDIARDYQNPPRYVNFYTWRDAQGQGQRTRAITPRPAASGATRSQRLPAFLMPGKASSIAGGISPRLSAVMEQGKGAR